MMSTFPPDPSRETLRQQEKQAIDVDGLSASSPKVQAIRQMITVAENPSSPSPLPEKFLVPRREAYWAIFGTSTPVPGPVPDNSTNSLLTNEERETLRKFDESYVAVRNVIRRITKEE